MPSSFSPRCFLHPTRIAALTATLTATPTATLTIALKIARLKSLRFWRLSRAQLKNRRDDPDQRLIVSEIFESTSFILVMQFKWIRYDANVSHKHRGISVVRRQMGLVYLNFVTFLVPSGGIHKRPHEHVYLTSFNRPTSSYINPVSSDLIRSNSSRKPHSFRMTLLVSFIHALAIVGFFATSYEGSYSYRYVQKSCSSMSNIILLYIYYHGFASPFFFPLHIFVWLSLPLPLSLPLFFFNCPCNRPWDNFICIWLFSSTFENMPDENDERCRRTGDYIEHRYPSCGEENPIPTQPRS